MKCNIFLLALFVSTVLAAPNPGRTWSSPLDKRGRTWSSPLDKRRTCSTSLSLGVASQFAMHSQVSIVNTGSDITLKGDIGVTSSGTSVAGISPESTKHGIVHVNNARASAAATDAATACSCAARSPLGTLTAADLGGQTFTPGNYYTAAGATTDAGDIITLNGAGSYFFHIRGPFTTGPDTQIVLTNGATACDVWWIVGDDSSVISAAPTTLGARTEMKGIICDHGDIIAGANVVSTGSWFTPSIISIDSGSFTSCSLDG